MNDAVANRESGVYGCSIPIEEPPPENLLGYLAFYYLSVSKDPEIPHLLNNAFESLENYRKCCCSEHRNAPHDSETPMRLQEAIHRAFNACVMKREALRPSR